VGVKLFFYVPKWDQNAINMISLSKCREPVFYRECTTVPCPDNFNIELWHGASATTLICFLCHILFLFFLAICLNLPHKYETETTQCSIRWTWNWNFNYTEKNLHEEPKAKTKTDEKFTTPIKESEHDVDVILHSYHANIQ